MMRAVVLPSLTLGEKNIRIPSPEAIQQDECGLELILIES
jgi:hypothetical protein